MEMLNDEKIWFVDGDRFPSLKKHYPLFRFFFIALNTLDFAGIATFDTGYCPPRHNKMEPGAMIRDYIAAILSGDHTLLRQLYRELFPMVRQMVRENGGTDDDAKDVFQDSLMVIHARAKEPDFQLTSQFSSFLYGIAYNRWRSRRKKKSNQEVTIPEGMEYTADGQPEFDHDRLERQKLFDKAFAQLGPDCRELLLLFFQKTPMTEIAARLGFASDNYARKRKHECKERLFDLIKKHPEYRELLNT